MDEIFVSFRAFAAGGRAQAAEAEPCGRPGGWEYVGKISAGAGAQSKRDEI